MKPSKKQIKPNSKKTKLIPNESTVPLIPSFFKAAPKSFVVDKTNVLEKPKDGDRQFYIDLLKSKLESFPDDEPLENGNVEEGVEQTDSNRKVETKTPVESGVHTSKNSHECTGCIQKAAEIEEWESKYKDESEQRKQLKIVYMNLNVEFTELYMKYQSLLKIVKGADSHGETTGVKATDCRIAHSEASEVKATDCLMVQGEASGGGTSSKDKEATGGGEKDSDDIFTDAEIKFLQFMPLDKKFDCSFILQCLKYAYRSDTTVLASRTLKGTSKRTEINSEGIKIHHEGKAPLSPIKVDRIKRLFMERISKCDIHSAEFVERVKEPYVNKLFAAGIGNLSKNNK